MAKRIIIFALVFMLVCGALFVSCKQDPVKDSKALGEWSAEMDLESAPVVPYYEFEVDIQIKDDKTFTGVVSSELVIDTEFSGTWEATYKTTGKITVTDIEKAGWDVALEIGKKKMFYCDGNNLVVFTEDESEAVRFNRVEPN